MRDKKEVHFYGNVEYSPKTATMKSLGYDLKTAESVWIDPQETKIVPTGFRLVKDLPDGVGMLIFPRSSTFLRYRVLLPNSPGLIDTDYSGPIGVILYNPSQRDVRYIPKGTRIAQALFVQIYHPDIIWHNIDPNWERKERGGFGSTGE